MRNGKRVCTVDFDPQSGMPVEVPHHWEYDPKQDEWYCRGCGNTSKVKPSY